MEPSSIQKQIAAIDPMTVLLEADRWLRVGLWRSGLGKLLNCRPQDIGQQLVIRFSNNQQLVPFYFFSLNDNIYAVCDPDIAAFCTNEIICNPAIEVWMNDGWFVAQTEVIIGEAKHALLENISEQQVFGNLGARIRRTAVADLTLLQITRSAARTGVNGPGQDSWIWAAGTAFFFFAWLLKRKK